MIILSFLNILLLFILLKIDRDLNSNNIFSVGSIFIYFSFIPAFSNLYFSFFQEGFKRSVLDLVAAEYRDLFYVKIALVMTFMGNAITYLGIYIGSKSKNGLFTVIMNKIFLLKFSASLDQSSLKSERVVLKFGLIVYFLGFVVYLIFLHKMGGLFTLWQELQLRTIKNAGLGYLQMFYTYAIQFGALILLWFAYKKKKKKLQVILIIGTIIIMGSMGARGPVIMFLFSILFMYHYLINRIHKLLNFKRIIIALLIPLFIVGMLQFRKYSFNYLSQNTDVLIKESLNSLESGFIARVGRLERDIVILKYFENNDYWWGKSFYGLIYAPIPRFLIPEVKPPNDTGMYLRVMALGKKVVPPMPIASLGNSGWPEGNWVGYMNWGFPGFIFFFFIAGLISGKYYLYLKKHNFPLIPTIIFSILAVGGVPVLSTLGIIKLIMVFFIMHLLILLIYIPFFKLRIK